jgi:hypothetical protein
MIGQFVGSEFKKKSSQPCAFTVCFTLLLVYSNTIDAIDFLDSVF